MIQKTRSKPLPEYADSLQSAAAMLSDSGVKCSVDDLKRAKRDGCRGFRGSRVYLAEVQEWLEENLPEETDDLESKDVLERRRLVEQIKRIRFAREVEQRKFVPIAEAIRDSITCGNATRGEVLQFIGDLPSLAGLSPEDMHARGMEWFIRLCGQMSTQSIYAQAAE